MKILWTTCFVVMMITAQSIFASGEEESGASEPVQMKRIRIADKTVRSDLKINYWRSKPPKLVQHNPQNNVFPFKAPYQTDSLGQEFPISYQLVFQVAPF